MGTLSAGNQTIDYGGDPASISFSAAPSGSGSFNYQWYYKDGLAAAPTGASTAGWTAIQGTLTSGLFDPGALAACRTYACYVIPSGTPTCGNSGWATGARQITVIGGSIITGTLAAGNQTFCNTGGDPASITFSATPTGLVDPLYTYQWYYMNGIPANNPTGSSTTGWTIISIANAAAYDPTGTIAVTRTYACMVGAAGVLAQWATGTRQITILPPFNPGTVTNADQTFCSSGNPANITLSTNPAGSGAFSWRWYFKESSAAACPSGSSISGWLTNSTSANITGTTLTGTGVSFDPMSAGANGAGRTFAVLITPIANGSVPACGTPQWASSCRKTFVNSCLPGEMPEESQAQEIGEEAPELGQSYPNPTANNITINYSLPAQFTNGTISFYTINGTIIKSVKINSGDAMMINYDCSELPSGTYFYSLESSGMKIATRKMVVIK